ncbi:MAG: NAD-dependent epimerase/dehydratase family protein, partial [Cyclobacteriaceae bacterium]
MILVTGANGFLGSFVCRELILHGHHVRALIREGSNTERIDDLLKVLDICNADLLDLPMLNRCFKDVDTVVHCAARISFQGHDCDELIFTNVESTRNAVNMALKHNVEKFIHISSTAAIGRNSKEET